MSFIFNQCEVLCISIKLIIWFKKLHWEDNNWSARSFRHCVKVCAILWSKEYKELISSHGFALNQLTIWKYPAMTKVAELTGLWHCLRNWHTVLEQKFFHKWKKITLRSLYWASNFEVYMNHVLKAQECDFLFLFLEFIWKLLVCFWLWNWYDNYKTMVYNHSRALSW